MVSDGNISIIHQRLVVITGIMNGRLLMTDVSSMAGVHVGGYE